MKYTIIDLMNKWKYLSYYTKSIIIALIIIAMAILI